MAKISRISEIINGAVRNLATLFKKTATRKTVQLSMECLEDKLLLTGMALLPHRPLLNDGGILSEHAFTPSALGFGVFNSGDLYSTSNVTSFSYFEQGHLSTDINYASGSTIITSILSEYSLEVHGTRSGNSVSFPGTVEFTYDFSFDFGWYYGLLSGDDEIGFSGTSVYGLDNILYTNLISSVLNELDPSLLSPSTLINITSNSTGTFSYEYSAEGVSSVSGNGSSQVPFLPLGHTGVDSYQYSGITTYTIDKSGNGTLVADNWFQIDGDASVSTLPDYTLALVCYSYEKDATLSVTSAATSVFTSNGTSSLIYSTQETFSASGSQAGGSYAYSSDYSSSGRETYTYSSVQTEYYNELALGCLSESSAGTFSYSGSTPTHTRLVDSLVESVAGTYSLNKYSHREINDGTGQRLSTITFDANGTTSNGKLLTDRTASLDVTRSDSYTFSGSADSTISYTGAASSSTWDRPNSFTQVETYSYSASYAESRSGSGSSLQTMLGSSEAGATFSHAGLTFTQEGIIESRELQSRSYSETSSTTSSSSGMGYSSLHQSGMPRTGQPSMSSFAYSSNGTSSLLAYESIGTMNFSGAASSRETFTSSDAASLNRLSPFLETITSSSLSSESYTAASTYSIASGLLQRTSLASYSESYSDSAQGTYANESYSLSSVAFDSTITGSHYYSEAQSYNLSTGNFLGTHSFYSQSLGTVTAAGPATLLGITSTSSSLNATTSYSFQGSSASNALLSTQYTESSSLRGTYSNGSYSYQSLVNHTNGTRDTSFESTDIFEITSGLATYTDSSGASLSSNQTGGNNGLVSAISGSNNDTSTGTTTLYFTQYNIHNLEGTSRVTFALDEYGSASHMTLSLTSINYQESASGLVTSTMEQRNYSSSLLSTNDYSSYDANESIALTGTATDFTYHSTSRSGDALGCITGSSAHRYRSQQSRSTLTSTQVTDFVYSNHVLGEYLNGKYSFSSMAYSATASMSSVATAYSIDTVANTDANYLLNAMPTGNSSMTSHAGDGTTGSSLSSSIGASRATVTNDLLSVTSTVYTNKSSHLETYSSLGVYSNFSTSVTSFANHSSGNSISTITFSETLTGSIVEASLANSSLSNGNGSSTGGGIQGSSGDAAHDGVTQSTTTISFNTSTTGYSHSQLDYETRKAGQLPSNLKLELTYYESTVSAAWQQYAQEIEDTTYSRTEVQTNAASTGASQALSFPGFIGPVEDYESNNGSDLSSQTVTITTSMERAGTTTYSAVGTSTSYEYGTYSEGDYDLSSVSYSSSSSSTASMTHAISSETDEGTSQAGTVNRGSNGYVAGANLSDGYQRDIESDADTSDRHTSQEVQTSSFSVQTSTQLQQGIYSHGSYSYSCLAYDRQSDSSQTISSTSSYSSTATIHAKSTDTEWVETLDKWNNVYRATGYVLTSWFAEYTQTLGIAGSDSFTITNHDSYASSIRGTSSGYDFSFSLISSTYDSFTTTSYSSSSSASSTYTGEHSTSLTGVLGSITGTDESSVSSTGTNTLHYKKQHLGLMVNGLATIVYDKVTVDTSNSVTNSTSQSTTLEGHHADFDVYQYDYSGATVNASQSSHDYTQVAFDSTATNPWSLSSYNSIQTVSNGFSYDDQSVFDMWHHVTASDPYSQTTWLYTHHRERSDTGSSAVTLALHTRGHSVADGSGGYSFVFDHYSVGISSSEGSTYSYSGYVSLLDQVSYTAPVGPYADSSNYSSFEWSKSRVRSGSESESIAGSTSGATFQYSSYSKNNTRDDDTEFEGYRYFDSTGPLGSGWSHQTLIYDENLEYDYTASTSDYTVSIDYTAPWTLSQSSSFLGTSSTSGTITKNEDDSGEDEKEVPAPVEVVGNFDGAKAGEYYGLAAGVVASYDSMGTAGVSQPGMLGINAVANGIASSGLEGSPRLVESAGATGLNAPDVPLQYELNRPALSASAGVACLGAENVQLNPSPEDVQRLKDAEADANVEWAKKAKNDAGIWVWMGSGKPLTWENMFNGMVNTVKGMGRLAYNWGKLLPGISNVIGWIEGNGFWSFWRNAKESSDELIDGVTESAKGWYKWTKGMLTNPADTIRESLQDIDESLGCAGVGAIIGAVGVAFKYCFVAGTPVSTEHGFKTIEELEEGERVWAHDFAAGQWRLCSIEATMKRWYVGDLVTINISGEKITSTGDHPYWVIEGEGLSDRRKPTHVPSLEPGNVQTPGRWVDARELKAGDVLLRRGGQPERVEAVSSEQASTWVYNLHVEELNNFAVGNRQWLVHNRDPVHHVVSKYPNAKRGWTPNWTELSRRILNDAKIGIESLINKTPIPGHQGPHPELYHKRVYERLREAAGTKSGKALTEAVRKELETIIDLLKADPNRLTGVGL